MDLSPPEREVVAADVQPADVVASERIEENVAAAVLSARQRPAAVRGSFIGNRLCMRLSSRGDTRAGDLRAGDLRAGGLRASRRMIRDLRRAPVKP